MKIFIQRTGGGEYWRRGRGWVDQRNSATAYRGVVEAIDCCIQSISGDADIVLEFGDRQAEVRLQHKGR